MDPGRRNVIWSDQRRAALDEAVAYISQDSQFAAIRLLEAALDFSESSHCGRRPLTRTFGRSSRQGDVMAIIPTVRCRNMRASLAFYTEVLDFVRVDGDDTVDDPSFSALARGADYIFLSSHRGDGEFGQAIAVLTDDVDALFRKFRERGLATPGNPAAPRMVHEGPIDQSWGTREFYVDDPDGNTLRFTQGFVLPPVSDGNG